VIADRECFRVSAPLYLRRSTKSIWKAVNRFGTPGPAEEELNLLTLEGPVSARGGDGVPMLFENLRLSILVQHQTFEQVFPGQVLLTRASGKNWRYGRFEDAFGELATVARDYEDLPWLSLQRVLTAEARRTGQPLELAGAKVAVPHVGRVGFLFLIAAQLYFVVHLNAFRDALLHRNARTSIDVAWIGIYASVLGRTLFVLSAAILPIGISLALVVTDDSLGASWLSSPMPALLFLGMSVVLTLAMQTLRTWQSVQRKVR
jgi:hypothetical protein